MKNKRLTASSKETFPKNQQILYLVKDTGLKHVTINKIFDVFPFNCCQNKETT